jgi:hypothetical protein
MYTPHVRKHVSLLFSGDLIVAFKLQTHPYACDLPGQSALCREISFIEKKKRNRWYSLRLAASNDHYGNANKPFACVCSRKFM